jgi:hypothetical protein
MVSISIHNPTFHDPVTYPTISPSVIDEGVNRSFPNPNKAAFALASQAVVQSSTEVESTYFVQNPADLLDSYLNDRFTLHSSALLALLKAAAYSGARSSLIEIPKIKNARLQMTLVQCLLVLDHDYRSPAYGAIGIALTVFAFSERNYPGWSNPTPLDAHGRLKRAIETIRYYERDPPSSFDSSTSLVLFGLMELLINHDSYNLDEVDLGTISQALLHHRLRPSSIDVYSLPQQAFRSDYEYITEAVIPRIQPARDGSFVYSETVRVAFLSALPSTFLDKLPQAGQVYMLVLENLRSGESSLIKQTCSNLLSRNLGHSLSILINDFKAFNPFELLVDILESEDERVLPYAMSALWRITNLLLRSAQAPSDKELILQAVLSHDPFLIARWKLGKAGTFPRTIADMGYLDVWLPRLEDMLDRIPQHVYQSDISQTLWWSMQPGSYDHSHPLWGRLHAFRERCKSRSRHSAPEWL